MITGNRSGKRLRIAFLSMSDPHDRRSWSGSLYFMKEALQRNVGEVDCIGPIHSKLELLGRMLAKLSLVVFSRKYDYKRSRWISRRYGRIAYDQLSRKQFDVVIAPAASTALAYLPKTKIPVISVSDATFSSISGCYGKFSDYLPSSLQSGNDISIRTLQRADIVVWASQWAADSARDDYGIDVKKMHVIPFGANIEKPPEVKEIQGRVNSGKCRLLFVGVDWERKGGEIAFETLVSLEESYGICAHLTVCGCTPPDHFKHERMRVAGFLNKNDPAQYEQLLQLFKESDYLLLPTRHECFGVVFCEASAFGLPSITTNTGGVPSVVNEGKNGFLLPFSARGDAYARVIHAIESVPGKYEVLVSSTRAEFDGRLNWDVWAAKVQQLIEL